MLYSSRRWNSDLWANTHLRSAPEIRVSMEKILSLALILAFLGCFGSGQTPPHKQEAPYRIHTLFSVECRNYFDWQTVGLMRSFKKAGQPGPVTRLLSCTDEDMKKYKGMHLAPTMEVPSMSRHPKTGDWYLLCFFFSFGCCCLIITWNFSFWACAVYHQWFWSGN